ncbi:hypothetical protein [Streptomyces sp. NBC_01264]|uniref:hypothetical protein n=1 Tax=Streptomyces sp. NBC_01264 TaxID=2903804 RepID=UPI00224C8056|nr:hypothetical protein [Streptomyces sp. NBC_01264]MCX4781530.1 hypothetical protein [Streptomyces sp. NBC_01264]
MARSGAPAPMPAPARPQRSRQWRALTGFLAVSYGVSALGALASADAGEVYAALVRPGWAPPARQFGLALLDVVLLLAALATTVCTVLAVEPHCCVPARPIRGVGGLRDRPQRVHGS